MVQSNRILLLVDGHAVLYRSFYGIKRLGTRAGVPTNAVYGLIKTLERLRAECSPTHWAVVFDGGIPARRRELVPEYKANRPGMPEDLRKQVPLVEEYLDCAGISRFRMVGEEADDVMASLAVSGVSDGAMVRVASSDKDMLQLISGSISVVGLGADDGVLDAGKVREKVGVSAGQIVDWLALMGDQADNIDGVAGVGPKTAVRLLERFGSVLCLYERLSEVESDGLRGKLEVAREKVLRNLEMVKLKVDLGVELDWEKLRVCVGDESALGGLYRKLEFTSLLKGFGQGELFGQDVFL